MCVWLTGLPAAGKTTIAHALEDHGTRSGFLVAVVDGDDVRTRFGDDLGFSRDDRLLNAERITALARDALGDHELVIVASVSPYRQSREEARAALSPQALFSEIWVSTPLPVCEQRDPKGLYAAARAGDIVGVTGVDDPYEAPFSADLVVDSTTHDVAHVVQLIWAHLVERTPLRVAYAAR